MLLWAVSNSRWFWMWWSKRSVRNPGNRKVGMEEAVEEDWLLVFSIQFGDVLVA